MVKVHSFVDSFRLHVRCLKRRDSSPAAQHDNAGLVSLVGRVSRRRNPTLIPRNSRGSTSDYWPSPSPSPCPLPPGERVIRRPGRSAMRHVPGFDPGWRRYRRGICFFRLSSPTSSVCHPRPPPSVIPDLLRLSSSTLVPDVGNRGSSQSTRIQCRCIWSFSLSSYPPHLMRPGSSAIFSVCHPRPPPSVILDACPRRSVILDLIRLGSSSLVIEDPVSLYLVLLLVFVPAASDAARKQCPPFPPLSSPTFSSFCHPERSACP